MLLRLLPLIRFPLFQTLLPSPRPGRLPPMPGRSLPMPGQVPPNPGRLPPMPGRLPASPPPEMSPGSVVGRLPPMPGLFPPLPGRSPPGRPAFPPGRVPIVPGSVVGRLAGADPPPRLPGRVVGRFPRPGREPPGPCGCGNDGRVVAPRLGRPRGEAPGAGRVLPKPGSGAGRVANPPPGRLAAPPMPGRPTEPPGRVRPPAPAPGSVPTPEGVPGRLVVRVPPGRVVPSPGRGICGDGRAGRDMPPAFGSDGRERLGRCAEPTVGRWNCGICAAGIAGRDAICGPCTLGLAICGRGAAAGRDMPPAGRGAPPPPPARPTDGRA